MILNTEHPIAEILKVLAPIVGANFVIKSARDSQTEEGKYPLIEYVIVKEGKATYDHSKKAWRVELIVVLSYMLQEDNLAECVPQEELCDSLAVQAIQFDLTGRMRRVVQLMVDPGSLGYEFKAQDFSWAKYDFKMVSFVESVYFRKHGADELTGASSLFILSLLDVDSSICCAKENLQQMYALLDPASVSARQLQLKIDTL